MSSYLLAIDQGTTSARAIIFDREARTISKRQIEIKQYFPEPGWVEHDPEEIWQSVLACCRQAVAAADLSFQDIVAIGITNQRETTVLWDRTNGTPIHRAIVWQDRRTAEQCQAMSASGQEELIRSKTGLLLDPYFSASKISWLLDHVPGARKRAEKGELMFGTIDSFILWRLTQGARHATDATNASRTLLFNIHTQEWDKDLLHLFNIPSQLLPQVLDSCTDFGTTHPSLFDFDIPIRALVGDQQAALIGQTCFQPGMIKSTYGTGTFLILNTGEKAITSKNRLLTTIAYRLHGKTTYALEGSIFSAGTIVQWLRDKLHLFKAAQETEALAASVASNEGVYFVPAFTGLGAPYWTPNARASIQGLTRDSQLEHIVRAGLEAVAYQTRDLLDAMIADGAAQLTEIRVDGGMTVNNWLMQFLADILNLPVERPKVTETTALGAAFLAGMGSGIFKSFKQISQLWQCDRRFEPQMSAEVRNHFYQNWHNAVKRVLIT